MSSLYILEAVTLAGDAVLGSDSNDLMEISTAQVSYMGLHLLSRMSRQMSPFQQMLGWNILVLKTTLGGLLGQSQGKQIFSTKMPAYQAVSGGPQITASHEQMLSASGTAVIYSSFSFFIFYRSLISRRLAVVDICLCLQVIVGWKIRLLQFFDFRGASQRGMSSIAYRMSEGTVDGENFIQKQDDAQFFSVAQEYNQRKAKMINFRAMQAMNMIHNFNIKNNPKDPKAPQAKQEKTRKTRSDKQGRQFTCGACNKSYLSYPALYTHIKTKHDGITPEGTVRGKNNNNKRRGRPKNLRAQPNLHHRPEPEFIFPKQYCSLVNRMELTFIEVEEDIEKDEQNQFKLQSQMFCQQVRQLKNSTAPLITLPIIKILTIFLYNVKDYIATLERSDQLLNSIESISERLVTFINSNHNAILHDFQSISNYFIRKEIPRNEVYCNYENCEYVPVFVSRLLKRLDAKADELEVGYLRDFCSWLEGRKLTHIGLRDPGELEAGGAGNDGEE